MEKSLVRYARKDNLSIALYIGDSVNYKDNSHRRTAKFAQRCSFLVLPGF